MVAGHSSGREKLGGSRSRSPAMSATTSATCNASAFSPTGPSKSPPPRRASRPSTFVSGACPRGRPRPGHARPHAGRRTPDGQLLHEHITKVVNQYNQYNQYETGRGSSKQSRSSYEEVHLVEEEPARARLLLTPAPDQRHQKGAGCDRQRRIDDTVGRTPRRTRTESRDSERHP